MINQDEDLLLSNEDQPPPAWWSPSSLLTPEVTSITAFTIAVISTSGPDCSMLAAQSVPGAPPGRGASKTGGREREDGDERVIASR